MKITEVTYRRVFNLGNYETLALELTAEINEGEDPQAALDQLAEQAKKWRASKERPS